MSIFSLHLCFDSSTLYHIINITEQLEKEQMTGKSLSFALEDSKKETNLKEMMKREVEDKLQNTQGNCTSLLVMHESVDRMRLWESGGNIGLCVHIQYIIYIIYGCFVFVYKCVLGFASVCALARKF